MRRPAPRRRTLAALGAALLAAGPARVAAQPSAGTLEAAGPRRLALVIGNADYRVGPLKNPVNDAQAMAEALKSLGFEVMLRENAGLRELVESMRQFALRASRADVRLLYYAGHGLQVRGRNYLLPVDAQIESEDEVPARSADVNEVLERLATLRHGINLVILDACRNNPFAGVEQVGPDGRRMKFRGAAPSGLARVDAPTGTLIAFATSPGGVALDSPGSRNSLYTRHLLEHIRQPGLPVELLFKQVRVAVARDTARQQVPWETSSLVGDFCFRSDASGRCDAGSAGGPR